MCDPGSLLAEWIAVIGRLAKQLLGGGREARLPGVIMITHRRHNLSTRVWSLLLRSPLITPIACCEPHFYAAGAAVRFDVGAVERAPFGRLRRRSRQHVLPNSAPAPAIEAVVHPRIWALLRWTVLPHIRC
jgi:hypothetical protein